VYFKFQFLVPPITSLSLQYTQLLKKLRLYIKYNPEKLKIQSRKVSLKATLH